MRVDVVVLRAGAVDRALDGVAGVVDDDDERLRAVRHHGPDLVDCELQAAVAGDEHGAAARAAGGAGRVEFAECEVDAEGGWGRVADAAVVGLVDVAGGGVSLDLR